MGANFQSRVIAPVATLRPEVENSYRDLQESLSHQFGSDPYNGSLSTLPSGLNWRHADKSFQSEGEAHRFLADTHVKWNAAMVVQVHLTETKTEDGRTFQGNPKRWLDANRTFDTAFAQGSASRLCVPCDQITMRDAERIKKAWIAFDQAKQQAQVDREQLSTVLRAAEKVLAEPDTFPGGRALDRLRNQTRKTTIVERAAMKKLEELDLRIGENLMKRHMKTTVIDKGMHWMIGGWCSE